MSLKNKIFVFRSYTVRRLFLRWQGDIASLWIVR